MPMPPQRNGAPMEAGLLRRRISIEYRPKTIDTYGFHSTSGGDTWTVILQTWAGIRTRPGSSAMTEQAGQIFGQSVYVVTMRYPRDVVVEVGMVVFDLHTGRSYEIQSVENVDERDRTMVLYCTEAPVLGA